MTIQQIKDLVSAGRLAQAFQEAKTLAQQLNDDVNTTAVNLLQGEFAQFDHDNTLGFLSFAEVGQGRAKYTYGLLNILNKMSSTPPVPPSQPIAPAQFNNILFLASNPADTAKLQLRKEFDNIMDALQDAPIRYNLFRKFDVTPNIMIDAMRNYKPGIVHFSGHGMGQSVNGSRASGVPSEKALVQGIVLQDDQKEIKIASGDQLRDVFSAFKQEFNIDVVFLNACYSENQAQVIRSVIPFVVAMSDAVPDDLAIAFAAEFYKTLGTNRNVKYAFDVAKAAVKLDALPGAAIPVLYQNN